MELSKSKLKAGDLLETMRFTFCADKSAFVSAFAKIGLPIKTEDDLLVLKRWHDEGKDVKGEIQSLNGGNLRLNISDFVKTIKISHDKLFKCSIKFVK